MKKSIKSLSAIIILSIIPLKILAQTQQPISLQQVLRLAENNSPQISASVFNNLAANKAIDVAKANYYPSLDFEAVDSTGFPGSSGGTGVEGLMGSPYRSGYGVGFVAQQTLWDFGQTSHGVAAAKYQEIYTADQTKVTIDQIKQLALQTYYECAFDKSQYDTWTNLVAASKEITGQVNHFVQTGQHSIVDGDLSQAQTDDGLTQQAYFGTALNDAMHRLAIIMGVPDNSFTCPGLPVNNDFLNQNSDMYTSPLLASARASADVAHEKAEQALAGYYPKLVAIASGGYLQNERLVTNTDNYSAGIGLIVPIFNFGTASETRRAELDAQAQDQAVSAEEQNLAEINANYDEIINASTVKLQHLQQELVLANTAFSEAKQRYFSMEGDLVDLRDAFTNLSRVQTEINLTHAQLLQAMGSKILVNGGRI